MMRTERILLACVTVAILLACASPLAADDPLQVYYAGPEDGVHTALELAADPALNPGQPFEIVADPAQAEVLVLNGTIPDPEAMAGRVQEGVGLVSSSARS